MGDIDRKTFGHYGCCNLCCYI